MDHVSVIVDPQMKGLSSSAMSLVTILAWASVATAQDHAAPATPPSSSAATPGGTPAPAAGTTTSPTAPASSDVQTSSPAQGAGPVTPSGGSRATPAAAGGPGDANPNAAGPGGSVVESPTSTTPVSNNPFVNRETPTALGGPGDPAAVAAGPGGFRIVALNKSAEIRFRALVQADGRFWFDDTQRPQINTFLIRRAQPWVEGRLPYGVTFFLNPDFGGGTVVLQDA